MNAGETISCWIYFLNKPFKKPLTWPLSSWIQQIKRKTELTFQMDEDKTIRTLPGRGSVEQGWNGVCLCAQGTSFKSLYTRGLGYYPKTPSAPCRICRRQLTEGTSLCGRHVHVPFRTKRRRKCDVRSETARVKTPFTSMSIASFHRRLTGNLSSSAVGVLSFHFSNFKARLTSDHMMTSFLFLANKRSQHICCTSKHSEKSSQICQNQSVLFCPVLELTGETVFQPHLTTPEIHLPRQHGLFCNEMEECAAQRTEQCL